MQQESRVLRANWSCAIEKIIGRVASRNPSSWRPTGHLSQAGYQAPDGAETAGLKGTGNRLSPLEAFEKERPGSVR